jgi:F0F1-type ATP synthase epsilon subunit
VVDGCRLLRFVIRTPKEVTLDLEASSIRVPTLTGQVGLRPRSESTILAIEAGLIVIRQHNQFSYAGTAGGLLRSDGALATLLTPLAVTGDDPDAVVTELDRVLAIPSEESEIRKALAHIELRIREELRSGDELHKSLRRGPT